jgi:endonuclease/exonuclease/phosphatase family metal-dependent hydrolase
MISLRSISFNLLWYVNLLSAFLLMLSYSAPFVSPMQNSWLAMLALGYPFLLLINLFWIGFWFYKKSRAVYGSLLTVVMGCGYISTLFGFGGEGDVPRDALRLMTYNVRYFNSPLSSKEDKWMESQIEILEYIKYQSPDLLFGQEFSGKGRASSNRADEILKSFGLSHQHRGGKSSLAIYSKFPLEKTGVIYFEGSANGAIHADVQLPGRKVRVYSVHLQSTRLGNDANEVLKKDNLKTLNKKETQEKYYRIEEKLSNAFQMRAAQAAILSEHIAASPYPVIVCGDFNDTPLSFSYRLMSKGLKDSFTEKGWGLGTTYAGALPALRIDYILVDKKIKIHTHKRQSTAISDHYALTSDVSFKNP